MKANSEHTVKVTLELTETEATWLARIMQNPLHGKTPKTEDTDDYTMRHKFFDVLTEAGI